MVRQRELFPPDRGLQARMAGALILWVVLAAPLLAGVVWLLINADWAFVAMGAVVGVAVVGGYQGTASRTQRPAPAVSDVERAQTAAQRLSMMASMPVPAVRVAVDPAPLSWTVAVPYRWRQIWLTTGLLERVNDKELEAVLGHELSHIAHLDALLMTVVAGPSTWILNGIRRMWDEAPTALDKLKAVNIYVGACISPIVFAMAAIGRIVSRHRELAADRGAAVLTGSPAALASVLILLSDDIAQIPQCDLRAIAARDPFHLLPVAPRRSGPLGRLWATHPTLHRRLKQLERMEFALQRARGGAVGPL